MCIYIHPVCTTDCLLLCCRVFVILKTGFCHDHNIIWCIVVLLVLIVRNCRTSLWNNASVLVDCGYCVCHRDQLLKQLFISIKQSIDDDDGDDSDTFDYEWLHEVGSGVDDCPLPHHVSSDVEIINALERVKRLLSRLPRPAAITIARLLTSFISVGHVMYS